MQHQTSNYSPLFSFNFAGFFLASNSPFWFLLSVLLLVVGKCLYIIFFNLREKNWRWALTPKKFLAPIFVLKQSWSLLFNN